jgi:flavin reductase (DIM6/NTAB) family NADH-FMN oxidoreductase RutF
MFSLNASILVVEVVGARHSGMTTRNVQRSGKPRAAIRAILATEQSEAPAAFPDNPALDLRTRFRTSLRLLASTVALVTAAHGTKRGGLTATAACSLSVDPPLMLVCVSRRSRTHGYMRESENFCINYLGEHHHKLAALFATQVQDGEVKFGSGAWSVSAFGNPILLDSLATIECRVRRRIDEGTHSVFIGTVLDVVTRNECEPLLYVQGEFAKPARDNRRP